MEVTYKYVSFCLKVKGSILIFKDTKFDFEVIIFLKG